ncbi:MAG: hypothetical protein C4533_02130 [Candidatus Omnitrophota bacterium]|jgi:hypothetical protein|nr:MAG: hypothetical protein C4533_02130 [Candidatus Omnitrophota bacterium]
MRNRVLIVSLLLVLFLLPGALTADDEWKESKSRHFIIYYKAAPYDFIQQVISEAEDYYDDIAYDLGFTRYEFWLWDNRAKIYIYNDAKDYQINTGQPDWSSGCAFVKDKVIKTYPNARSFFNSVLPHEMGHIIFREFVGFNNPAIPIWLEEGVASYQEKARLNQAKRIIKQAIKDEAFIELEQLSGKFNLGMAGQEAVSIFYAESLSIVDYLIREFGKDNFVLFCQALRDKKNLDRALSSAYRFNNSKELSIYWKRYLGID